MYTCLSPNGSQLTSATGRLDTLLVATLTGALRLERAAPGQPWTLTGRMLGDFQISALLHEPRSGRLFAGTHGNKGFWASDDDGRTWRQLKNGLTSDHVYTIAVQYRGDRTVLFVGTEPAMLFRSDDLGESFTELPAMKDVPDTDKWRFPPPPHIAHVKQVCFHPTKPETYFVCIEQGALLKTIDDGKSWVELHGYEQPDMDIKFRHDAHRVVQPLDRPSDVYFCAGEGLYVSHDEGATWLQLQSRFDRIGYPDALFLDPRDQRTLYMGGAGEAPEEWRNTRNALAGVIRTRDGGRTWDELKNGLPAPVRGNIEAVAHHHAGDYLAIVAGTATGEVYLSDDAGESWSCIASGLPPISKAGHYRWFLSEEERAKVVEQMKAWKDPYQLRA